MARQAQLRRATRAPTLRTQSVKLLAHRSGTPKGPPMWTLHVRSYLPRSRAQWLSQKLLLLSQTPTGHTQHLPATRKHDMVPPRSLRPLPLVGRQPAALSPRNLDPPVKARNEVKETITQWAFAPPSTVCAPAEMSCAVSSQQGFSACC